mmetsp:Transcript_101062/g.290879  ORF Transcript_101062/g.290879 Transcript_101062/m.290879 type:complete len:255 (-) Transcript_101062:539-1303(-)
MAATTAAQRRRSGGGSSKGTPSFSLKSRRWRSKKWFLTCVRAVTAEIACNSLNSSSERIPTRGCQSSASPRAETCIILKRRGKTSSGHSPYAVGKSSSSRCLISPTIQSNKGCLGKSAQVVSPCSKSLQKARRGPSARMPTKPDNKQREATMRAKSTRRRGPSALVKLGACAATSADAAAQSPWKPASGGDLARKSRPKTSSHKCISNQKPSSSQPPTNPKHMAAMRLMPWMYAAGRQSSPSSFASSRCSLAQQ